MNLRRLFLLNAFLFGLLALALVFALILFTSEMRASADRMEIAIKNVHAAEKLEIALLSHDRFLQYNPPGAEAVKSLIIQNLKDVEFHLDTEEERAIYKNVQINIEAYFKSPPLARRNNLTIADASLKELVDINIRQSESLQKEIQKSQRLSELVGLGCLALLIIAGSVISILHHTKLAKPLTILHGTLKQFSAAPFSTIQSGVQGVREINEISSTIQQMSETMIRQRESQFKVLAAIAHDLRNPLSGIRMSIDILSETKEPEEIGEILEIVRRQAVHLDRLVGDLLDTTRIEAGDILLKPAKIDLRDSVKEAVTLFKVTTENHALEIELPERPMECACDPHRISQVLNNLLSNAIKYSPEGGKVIVKASCVDSFAKIEVCDQGIGIAEEDLSSIFEPFHRTAGTRQAFPGVGLGLSAARKIIEAHDGKIEVHSEVGKGTTFQIFLPLHQYSAASLTLDSAP